MPELILRNYRKKKKHLSVAFFFHKALALHEFVLSNRWGGGIHVSKTHAKKINNIFLSHFLIQQYE